MLLLLACVHAPPPESVAAPAPPPPAPPEPAWLEEGELAGLLANAGSSPLVVNFWATWCGPCVRELPELATVAGERPDVRFVLVSVDRIADHGILTRFLSTQRVGLDTFHLRAEDPSAALNRVVPEWPDIIPVTLVLDAGGAERVRFEGALDVDGLRTALSP